MSTDNVISFQAPDGHTVYYRPNDTWRTWHEDDVYNGTIGLNKHVPKAKDHVWRPLIRMYEEVISLVNYIPVYGSLTQSSNGDAVLSSGVGADPSTWRLMYDKHVVPYAAQPDGRMTFVGDDLSYAVLFKGVDTSRATGTVLSKRFGQGGEFLDDRIPLRLVDTILNPLGSGSYYVPSFNVTEELLEGESVTLVIYNANNSEYVRQKLFVNHNTFTARVEDSTKYVTHLGLISDMLSRVTPNTLEVPQNVTIDALNLRGVVHFRDGSKVELPVDQDRFKVTGIEGFFTGQAGFKQSIPLVYKLSPGEQGESVSASGGEIVQPFTAVSVEQNGSYSVKLVGYPQWRADINEYQMRWFLTNLNRNVYFDVTAFVHYNSNGDVFNPTGYGRAQRLSVRLNLADVSGTFPSYLVRGSQTVSLNAPGGAYGSSWSVAFVANQEPMFGIGLGATARMVNHNLWRLNVRGTFISFDEWLKAAFYDTIPIYDYRVANRAPEPTHMRIFSPSGANTIVEIGQWNSEFTVGVNFTGRTNVQIGFLRKVGDTMLELGIACMPLKIIA